MLPISLDIFRFRAIVVELSSRHSTLFKMAELADLVKVLQEQNSALLEAIKAGMNVPVANSTSIPKFSAFNPTEELWKDYLGLFALLWQPKSNAVILL